MDGNWMSDDWKIGDRGYNHYDDFWGEVVSEPDDIGWFDVLQENGTTANLNNVRFIKPDVAKRFGLGQN